MADKILKLFKKKLRLSIWRRFSQLAGLGFGLAGILVPTMTHLIYPGLHCYSCPLSITICSIGLIQNLVKNQFPLYPLGFVGLYGVLTGRAWCGWFCPFGLLNDVAIFLAQPGFLKRILTAGIGGTLLALSFFTKDNWRIIFLTLSLAALLSLVIPLVKPKNKINFSSNKLSLIFFICFVIFMGATLVLSLNNLTFLWVSLALCILSLVICFFLARQKAFFLFKFIILLLTIGLALIVADPIFCKLCPSATLSAALPYLASLKNFILPPLIIIKISIFLIILIGLLIISRFFCRLLCPLGAIFGLTNKISLLKLKKNTDCFPKEKSICKTACQKACIMGIKVYKENNPGYLTDCIRCGRCVEACPNQKLNFSFFR